MRMHKSPPAVGSVDINQKGKYLLNSQTVNDLQTRSSYWFDGVDDSVDIVNDPDNNFGTGDFSIELWAKKPDSYPAHSATSEYLVAKGDASGAYSIRIAEGSEYLSSYFHDGSGGSIIVTATSGSIKDDKWHHVVFSFDRSANLSIYVDGILVGSGDITSHSGSIDSAVNLAIGNWSSGQYRYEGEMSQVRLYNRALSSDEVKAAYSGEAVPFADIGANQTALVSSAFGNASGYEYETFTGASSTGFTAAQTSDAEKRVTSAAEVSVVLGKKYRVRFDATLTSGMAPHFNIRAAYHTGSYVGGVENVEVTAGANVIEFTSDVTAVNRQAYFRTNLITNYTISNLSLVQIGNVAEYLPTSIGATQWLDTSGNGLDGTVTGATQTHPTVFGSNVGIGTASPSAELQVGAITATAKSIRLEGSGANEHSLEYSSDDNVYGKVSGGKYGSGIGRLQFHTYSGGSLSPHLTIDADGNVGIGADLPAQKLDVRDGNFTAVFGADSSATTLTNSTVKAARLGMPHYTNAELPSTFIVADSSATTSGIDFGGGTSLGNAMTQIRFFTAANTTTPTGTERLRISSDGTLDQKSNYLVNSQTVNDLQTKQSYHFDNPDTASPLNNTDFILLSAHGVQSEFCAWGYGSFSVEVWIKSSAIGVHQEIVSALTANYPRWGFRLRSDNKIGTFTDHYDPSGAFSNIVTTNTITDNKWHHLVWTVDREDLTSLVATGNKLYIDGVEASYDTQTAPINRDLSIASKLFVGASYYQGDRPSFQGEISTVRSYNRLLSADEVKASYSGQAVPYVYTGASQTTLVTNGDFSANSGWTLQGNWTIDTANNKITATNEANSTDFYQTPSSPAIEKGRWYAVTYEIADYSSGSVYVNQPGTGTIRSANGTYTDVFQASQTYVAWRAYGGGTTLSIKNVSMRLVGCVAEYLPTSIGATQWLDTSGNGLHGAVTGATQVGQNIFGGNVGIGTDSPSNKALTVVASDNGSLTGVAGFYANNLSVGVEIHNQGIKSATQMADGSTALDANADFKIDTKGTGDLLLVTNSSGKVGIGQTVPSDLLHVSNGNIRLQAESQTSGDFSQTLALRFSQETDSEFAKIMVSRPSWAGAPSDMSFWTRDYNSGSINNVMELSNDGTLDQKSNYLVNSQTVNDLQAKQSLRFDGTDDYVTITDHLLSTDLSVSLWFNSSSLPTASATVQVLACNPQGFGIALYYTSVGGGIFIIGTTVSQRIANVVGLVSVGEWNHLAVTYDATGIPSYYLNGVEITTYGTSNYLAVTSSDYYIGRRASGYAFEGEISKFQVYNRALSADEVKASYSGQAVPFSETGANQTDVLSGWDLNSAVPAAWVISGSGSITDDDTVTMTGAGGPYTTGFTWVKGKKYRMRLAGTRSTTAALNVYLNTVAGGIPTVLDVDTASGAFDVTNEFTVTHDAQVSEGKFYIRINGACVVDFTHMSVTRVGAVAEYLPTSIGDTTWLDTSGNALHGTVTGATQVGQNIFGGPVGIGTNDPGARLEVLGPNAVGEFFTAGNYGAAGVVFQRIGTSSPHNSFDFWNGSIKIGTAGMGIDFSNQASPATGMTSELLDRYEEGTFTVALGGTTETLANATAYYTRIGNVVYFAYYSQSSTLASATGTATITGLPFTSAHTSNLQYHIFNSQHTTAVDGSSRGGYIVPNDTYCIWLDENSTSGASYIDSSNLYIMVSGCYRTAT